MNKYDQKWNSTWFWISKEIIVISLLLTAFDDFCNRCWLFFLILNQVDKLEESEAARVEEKKEEEYKPVVMGKNYFLLCFWKPWISFIQDVMVAKSQKVFSIFFHFQKRGDSNQRISIVLVLSYMIPDMNFVDFYEDGMVFKMLLFFEI